MRKAALVLGILIGVIGVISTSVSATDCRDRLLIRTTEHGEYVLWLPPQPTLTSRVIVLVHGTIGEEETALELAERFAERWMEFVQQEQHVLIAPAFDQRNFGGRDGPGGGYRGLFGREIGADEFINEIVDLHGPLLPIFDGRFYLYGHSAGGQLVSRYAVIHPERLLASIMSAPGTYAFPDPEVQWTNGMLPLQRELHWTDPEEITWVDIHPNPVNWLEVAQMATFVVVGGDDLEPISSPPGNKGNNRVERAQYWVQDMNQLAADHGKQGSVELTIVPGIGHSSRQLTPYCIDLIARHATDTDASFRVTADGRILADGSFYGQNFLAGAADIAEWVSVSEPVEPGDVLELDPENPGHYRRSRGPCSTLVAGVVSTDPGFVLGSSSPTLDSGPWTDDSHFPTDNSRLATEDSALLALIGIVPVKVTNEGGPVKPGDVLVASSTPGYAMRWDPEFGEACGLIGKALEPLEEKRGVILVILTR
jgi:pimeloyl-ACP methyl ester carboxylesterase